MASVRAVLLILLLTAAGCSEADRNGDASGTTSAEATAPASTSAGPTSQSATPPPPPATSPAAPPPAEPPVVELPNGLYGVDWETIPTQSPVVALTFDAGANGDGVQSILDTLAREGVPGTFFLTGRWVEQYPDLARTIASTYPIGNHSVSHPYFTQLSDEEISAETLGAADSIRTVTGVDPAPLFRFPFGDRDAHTISVLNSLGYVPIRWTVDTLGWKGTSGGMSAQAIVDRVVAALTPGEIVLMHVGGHPQDLSTLDADALPSIIQALRDRGYGFVSLETLVGG